MLNLLLGCIVIVRNMALMPNNSFFLKESYLLIEATGPDWKVLKRQRDRSGNEGWRNYCELIKI